MARKHEHFGLSYLEELNIVKGRENICKESRHEFMKFKQEFTSDHGNVNKALQEVTPPSQSLQIRSKTISPFLCSESKQLSSELDTSGIQKKIRIACDDEEETIETEDTPSQPKKSSKKQNHTDGKKRAFHSGKTILEHKSESPGDEVEKMPVLIASFVGTTKQMTILKKPGPLKPKSPKIPCAKLRFKGQSKDSLASSSKPLEQKILSQHIVLPTAGTSSADFDDTSSVISSVNEKSMTISKEDSESNVPSCLERSYSTKGSASSSIKFAPAHLEETISESRLGLSKSHLKSFSSYSKSQVSHSISKLPSGIVSRSIDEIIESLKSTVPTDSDLKIKELLESILGQDYLIKIQSGIKKEMQPNELELPAVRMAPVESDIIKLKPSHIRKDRSVSPSAYQGIQLIPEDSEQEIPESSQARSISYSVQLQPSEMREHIAGIEVTNGIMPTATEESDYVFKTVSLEQQSIHESEIYSFSEIEETPESIVERSKGLLHLSSEEKLEDFASSSMGLIIQGKAFPKARPVEIQKSVEDLQYQQPVSLLSTWTTKIKEVDYPLIHLLCTTSPGFVLPSNLRLVSRVYHTIDKAGHGISLPPINFDCHNSEGLFPVTAAFEEQIYRERIYNEGLPISEVCQSSQEDGIQVLPPKSPRSMPEWQRIAEFYVEKPQLKLLGKKMKLQPGSLKMFWTPAPHKFSAPLSVMKEILFSKYESNLVHGVIYEDFSIDLQEKEKAEDEDDVDYLFSNISANGRCGSFPELAPKEHLLKRPNSAPELSSYRDKTLIKISANFKTVMEELDIMSKHVPLTKPKAAVPEAETSPEKDRRSPTANLSQICFSPSKPLDTEKVSETIMGNTLRLPKGNLFEVEPAEGFLDQTALADKSRKAGIKYIIFPKKKRKLKKMGKSITPRVLDSIFQKLNEPPKVLKRSVSLTFQKLKMHNKYSIKISRAIQLYRSPSLPCLLDFETFAKKQGKRSEDSDYLWTRLLWNKWFEELFVPINKTAEDKQKLGKHLLEQKIEDAVKEKELPNYVNPFLFDGKKEELAQCEHEIERITQEINTGCATAFNYCRRGAIYRKIGKMQSALDDLEKAIHLEPLLANAHWHRHLIFIYQNKILPALEDLNFVIKYNISYTDAYLSRAQIYRKQGKNHLAMINYTLALRYRPTDPEIYYKRGEVHEEEGELILAMEDYSKCLYYDPQSVDACMKHGIYYFNKSNWTIAMNDFTTVIKKDPKHAEARTYRARIYIKQEQYKNAAEDLSAAIHLNPRNWIAFYYRGCILRKIDPKQSLQDLSVSVLLNHRYDNIGAYLHRGILYAELKQWPLAICDFENAIALDRSLTTPYINIGLITMLHSDQYFDAILRFTEAIRVDPLDVRPYLCRAQAYQKVHDLKNSVKDINRAIHLHPNLPHLFLTRGQYLLQMKHFQLASFCIHQVAEMDKGSLGCSLVQEALVQSFCQNYNKAIECAIAATRNQPEPALYNLLGKIQMKAKKFKDALSSLNEALMLLAGTDKCLPNTFEAAELYFLMGQCYMEQVFLLEACDAFTSAVRLYPRYADAFYQRGLCRMQLQQAKCILDFNKTLAIVPRHFQAYISRAAYYGSKGRYSKAIMNCTEALKIEPCSVRGYLYRGVLKFYNRTYKHAVEDLTKAIKLDKVCTLAYYNRAIAFQQLKDYEHSLIDYETVLHLETNKDIVLKVLKNRALVYIEMKRYDYALKDFAEVAMIEQKNTELLNAIGLCYHRLQKYEEAVESFSKVLKLNPFVLDAYIGRGNAYLEYGHSKGTRQALKDFLTAVHINPVCIKARLCLGYSLQALGKFQKAWTQFSAAIHCDPSCHIAYDGRAIVCLQMGDIFAAFQDTNAALKIITNAELLTNRGVINQFMGYLNCAMRDYQQAITIDPNYALAYFNAANVYFLNKQFSQANDYYDKAIELDPQNESAFLNRAITNTLLKKFEEAKTDFEKAISLSPLSAAIYFNKANLYSMLQQYEQAEEDISKALSIQPYDALMYKLRADIRGKMGLIQEAIADYKKAISIQELINSN
ncbi:tetratricopeptide repeat protein 6 isoform X2 [Crotalus tigris]|uniref:tetratricopeptide repeat protein 6 isoform X2 n=1 Tax=Crotalus tigris TaxID=88082 RepID=UPI00192F9F40|nr:tetratricopeptide repeat protein 6 isoform X2 [Crotalus tigris]